MTKEITSLRPQRLWQNFYQITQIPHPSGCEKALMDWIEKYAQDLKLTVLRTNDYMVIRKPATAGSEGKKPIILQCHADMVPQKLPEKEHNFEKDPICAKIEGNLVVADGTTLGADNGIGLAAALSILADPEAQHGPLEVLITTQEETTMGGAFALQPAGLQGKTLLNLDSETEGELYIGCAGGQNVVATFDYYEVETAEEDVAYEVKISGLRGGHSGMDIDLGRANAIKLMARFLKYAVANYEAMVADIGGGNMHNAIPREAFATLTIDREDREDFLEDIQVFEEIFRNEYRHTEPDLRFTAQQVKKPRRVIEEMNSDDLINALQGSPCGVLQMSSEMGGMVDTSANLAIVKKAKKKVEVTFLIRSACETRKEDVASQIESIYRLAGARPEVNGDYPGWMPNPDSEILATVSKVYTDTFGQSPKVKSIHAGLECGIFAGKTDWDMVSFGPTIHHPHSPAESVEIDSVERFYEVLKKVLSA